MTTMVYAFGGGSVAEINAEGVLLRCTDDNLRRMWSALNILDGLYYMEEADNMAVAKPGDAQFTRAILYNLSALGYTGVR